MLQQIQLIIKLTMHLILHIPYMQYEDLIPPWYKHVRDREYGCFYTNLTRDWKPAPPWETMPPMISRQIFGSFLQLYRLTGGKQLLNNFRKSETFWLDHFRDAEHGGIFPAVSPQGTILGAGEKASSWHTSYHEIEHGLLNYLYLNLYVNRQPAELHFNIKEAKTSQNAKTSQKHYVSLVDDPSVRIGGVKIGDESWTDFNTEERSVTLPEGKNLRMKITLIPGA